MFLEPINWIAGRTSQRGFLGITVGHEVFTDLDFADDISIMAEMLEIVHEEYSQLGLEIKCKKTKKQAPESLQGAPSMVPIIDHQVEVVDSFPRITY